MKRKIVEGNMKKLIVSFSVIAGMFAGVIHFQTVVFSQTKPFTIGQILRAISTPSRDKKALYKKIANDVRNRGVDFPLTAENETLLRNEGATEELIEAIRQQSPKLKPTPTSAATPTPMRTPVPTPITVNNNSGAATARKIRKNSIGMELVYIPSGDFMMGSSEEEIAEVVFNRKKYSSDAKRDDFANETPRHKVSIKEGFWMGRFEVTQAQWQAVMGDNPSKFIECGANCPVEQVSWDDIKVFLKRLNTKDSQFEHRLPSEAEWEYAARARTTTVFSFGDSLNSSQANFDGNYPYASTKGEYIGKSVAVGSYQPNAFGLYDMHGNVWEWCQDIYNSSYRDLPTNGSANLSVGNSNSHVLRGGAWDLNSDDLRSANRSSYAPAARYSYFGFRLAARVK